MMPLVHSGINSKNIKKEYSEYNRVLISLFARIFNNKAKENLINVNNKRKFKRNISV